MAQQNLCYSYHIMKTEKNLCLRLKDYFKKDTVLRKDYVKVTTPMLLIAGTGIY